MSPDQVAVRLRSIDDAVRALGKVITEVRQYFQDNKCVSAELMRKLEAANSMVERLVSPS